MPQQQTEAPFATDRESTARLEALHACACPHEAGNAGLAPRCHAERLLGMTAQLLIVTLTEQGKPSCSALIHFGSGYFCRCSQRIDYYKTYGC